MLPNIEPESAQDVVAAIDQAKCKLEQLSQNISEQNARLKTLSAQLAIAGERLAEVEKAKEELHGISSQLKDAHQQLETLTSELNESREELTVLRTAKHKLAAVKNDLAAATAKLVQVTQALTDACSELETVKKAKVSLANINNELKDSNDRLNVLNENLREAHEQAVLDSRLKTQFMANISHEIRTPLSGIHGMCELLVAQPLDPHSHELAKDAYQAAQNLLGILNSLLDFSKLAAGRVEPDRHRFSIASTIQNVLNLVQPQAAKRKISLQTIVAPEVPAEVLGDSGRVEQILLNLAHNAVKFTEHGEVTIGAEILRSGVRKVTARFWVEDTGIGIPDSMQKSIFEPFVQADGSATRKYGGTGLGLAIAKQLVTIMSGDIGLTSAEGRGSTFWFIIPLDKE